ncbi:MAG TPA: hypothetical protein VGM32_21310 [Rhodopila sp.]
MKAIKAEQNASEHLLAELVIDVMTSLGCGERVRRLGDNHFLVPAAKGSLSQYTMHYFQVGQFSDERKYFRSEVLYVEHINAHTGVATMRFFVTDGSEEGVSGSSVD